jgi:glycosyltransferase involved in cell wall biosynthesis
VNDCSPDCSRDIVIQCQQEHTNLVLIDHEINKKAGGARNTGLRAARGEYIWFVDADDTIEPNALKKVLYHCQKDYLDALCFNYNLLYKDRIVAEKVFNDSMIVQNGVSFLLNTFSDKLIYNLGFPWRTIYRRSILWNCSIRFPEQLLFGEDTTFMQEGIMHSNRVKAISDVLYNYRQNVSTSSSAQLTELRGMRIYESIFCAGELIVLFKNQAAQISLPLANAIEKGLPWFVNRLFIRLIKTSMRERKLFYKALYCNQTEVLLSPTKQKHQLFAYLDRKNRFVVRYPMLGKILLDILSPAYKLKHC